MKLPFQWRVVVTANVPPQPYPKAKAELAEGEIRVPIESTVQHEVVVQVTETPSSGAPLPSAWRPPTIIDIAEIFAYLYEQWGGPSNWSEYYGTIAVAGLEQTYRNLQERQVMKSAFGRGFYDWSSPLDQDPTPPAYRSYGDPNPTVSREATTMSAEYVRREAQKPRARRFLANKLTADERAAASTVAERFMLFYPGKPYTLSSIPGKDGQRLWWVARAQDDPSKIIRTEGEQK